jgi:hypothetical protein
MSTNVTSLQSPKVGWTNHRERERERERRRRRRRRRWRRIAIRHEGDRKRNSP